MQFTERETCTWKKMLCFKKGWFWFSANLASYLPWPGEIFYYKNWKYFNCATGNGKKLVIYRGIKGTQLALVAKLSETLQLLEFKAAQTLMRLTVFTHLLETDTFPHVSVFLHFYWTTGAEETDWFADNSWQPHTWAEHNFVHILWAIVMYKWPHSQRTFNQPLPHPYLAMSLSIPP